MSSITTFHPAYVAGVVDSDGHIGITRLARANAWYYRVFVTITQFRDDNLYVELPNVFGGSPYISNGITRWAISGKGAACFLEWIKPFLAIKAAEAETALCFARTLGPRGKKTSDQDQMIRADAYLALRQLKAVRYGR